MATKGRTIFSWVCGGTLLLAVSIARAVDPPARTLTVRTLECERVDGSRPWVKDVAFDGAGAWIAVGTRPTKNAGHDLTVARWDATGRFQWRQDIQGTAAKADDEADGLAVDRQNNIVVAGTLKNQQTGRDFVVLKWDAAGKLLWRRELATRHDDKGGAVAVDGEDNVIAAAAVANDRDEWVFTVAKWNAAGELQWRRELPRPNYGVPDALAVHPDGSITVAGTVYIGRRGRSMHVSRLNPGGRLLWRQEIAGKALASLEMTTDVAVDTDGSVAVAGALSNLDDTTSTDYAVSLLGADGTVHWTRTLRGASRDDLALNQAWGVAFDPQGNVVAAGTLSERDEAPSAAVTKWSRAGKLLWRRRLAPDRGEDTAFGVAVDPAGRIVATGWVSAADLRSTPAIAYWAADGHPLGIIVAPSMGKSSTGDSTTLTVDMKGNALAAGVMTTDGVDRIAVMFTPPPK